MNTQTKKLVQDIISLTPTEQNIIKQSSSDELPEVLKDMGISLPSSNWILRILKILLYSIGIILAGVGTSATAQSLIF